MGELKATFSTGLEVLQCSRTVASYDRSPVGRSGAEYPLLHGPPPTLPRLMTHSLCGPWQVSSIEVVGPVLGISVKRVVQLKPDLILASLNVPGMERVVPRLQSTGLPVVIYDPETWQDVLDNLLDLGDRLGIADRAQAVVADAEASVEALQAETQALPWLKLCVEWWPDPVIVPHSQTYVNHVLSWVKVENPFSTLPGRSGKIRCGVM